MIHIVRERTTDSIDLMIPNFTVSDDKDSSRQIVGIQIRKMILAAPESINILQAWKGDDLISFIIGTLSETPYVWIPQGWSKQGNSHVIISELFSRLFLWTIAVGRNTMRYETARNTDAMYRRFGFKPIASILERTVTTDEISNLLKLGKETVNG